jgi:hypothetical protein
MVGDTNFMSPLNQLLPSLANIGVPKTIPYIVFYQGLNLPLKWSRSVNHTDYTYTFVSINPSGTHVATVATYKPAGVANFWINIF